MAWQEHFLTFCCSTNVTNPCLDLPTLTDQNYFLDCYAISLIQGKTISGIAVCSNTVKNYIHAACNLFTDRGLPTPRSAKTNFIDIITRTLRNYKNIPKRCNMITNEMTLWMIKYVKTLPSSHPHGTIFNWIALGQYTGFRASEWCQTFKSNYKCITAWPSQPPEAFIAEDFEFFLDGEIPVHNITNMPLSNISSICICWRTQKNKQNGEKIPFFSDANNPNLCPVAAVLHIVHRSLLLHNKPGLPPGDLSHSRSPDPIPIHHHS